MLLSAGSTSRSSAIKELLPQGMFVFLTHSLQWLSYTLPHPRPLAHTHTTLWVWSVRYVSSSRSVRTVWSVECDLGTISVPFAVSMTTGTKGNSTVTSVDSAGVHHTPPPPPPPHTHTHMHTHTRTHTQGGRQRQLLSLWQLWAVYQSSCQRPPHLSSADVPEQLPSVHGGRALC